MEPTAFRLAPLSIACPRISAPRIDGRVEEGKWKGASRVTRFEREDGEPALTRTAVWIGRDDGYLYIAARCEERNTGALRQTGSAAFRGLHSRDHVEIYLNPEHDHVSYRTYIVAPFEHTESARGSYRLGWREGPGSRWFHVREETRLHPMYIRYASAIMDGEAWSFEMAIPFESLETDPPGPGSVFGLNVVRYTAWPVYQGPPSPQPYPRPNLVPAEWSAVAALRGYGYSNPLTYADLLFDDRPMELRQADFGVPHFGFNKNVVRFEAPDPADLVFSTNVRPRQGKRIIDPAKEHPLKPEGEGKAASEFAWKAAHWDDTNVLELTVKDRESGRTCWHGSYEFGWESGSMPLYYLRRGETDGPVAAPDPSDPDFLVKKACWIAARQHRFHRRNTADGAPSDFTLESSDGAVRFNLMDTACLDEMAQYVYDAYDNDQDRLLGMLFFAGQPAVIRAHPAYDWHTSDRLENMTLLRFGSGYCGHMARVMALILNRMRCDATGENHRARKFGIGGHGLVFVEYRGDYAILDSKHVSLYYRVDNTDLATLREYREQPEIARRAYPFEIPALMTFNRDHIPHTPLETLDGRGLVWP